MESRERLRARANETIAKAEHDYRIAMHATKAIKQGFIYFIGTDDAEFVKIGFTLELHPAAL